MPRDPNCVFCKIVAADLPAAAVYEDDAVLAFLDIGPLADGHLIVIPREHQERLSDLSAEIGARLGSTLPKMGRALLKVTGSAGFNVLLNQGGVAGQMVQHVHYHLIPRKEGDQLGYRWNAGKYAPGRAADLAAKLQDALARHDR